MDEPEVHLGYGGGNGESQVSEIEIDLDHPVAREPIVSGGDAGDVIVIMRHKSPTADEAAQDDA